MYVHKKVPAIIRDFVLHIVSVFKILFSIFKHKLCDIFTAHYPCYLILSLFMVESSNSCNCPVALYIFLNKQMIIRHNSHLGKVGHAKNLPKARYLFQLYTYLLSRSAAYSCVYLVKYQRADTVLIRKYEFQSKQYT